MRTRRGIRSPEIWAAAPGDVSKITVCASGMSDHSRTSVQGADLAAERLEAEGECGHDRTRSSCCERPAHRMCGGSE